MSEGVGMACVRNDYRDALGTCLKCGTTFLLDDPAVIVVNVAGERIGYICPWQCLAPDAFDRWVAECREYDRRARNG